MSLSFSQFTSSGLSVTANRYVQYRTVFESEDQNTLCTYASASANCSPELQSVSVGPTHYDTTVQSITSQAAIGSSYQTLDTNGFTATLGANSCTAGITYTLSSDGTNFYDWNGSSWTLSSGSAQASSAADISANLSSFPQSAAKTGTLQIRSYLKSNGTSPCELDNLQVTGQKN